MVGVCMHGSAPTIATSPQVWLRKWSPARYEAD